MKSTFSFIITRPNGRAHRFKLSSIFAQSILIGGLLMVFIFCLSLAVNVKLIGHYQDTKTMTEEQEVQATVIQTLQGEVQSLRQMMEELIKKEEAIRQDLGKPKYRRLSQRRLIKKKTRKFARNYPKSEFDSYAINQLSNELDYLKKNTLVLEKK